MCLTFTATVSERGEQEPVETLLVGGELGRFLLDIGLLEHAPAVATHELAGARRLREAIYRSAAASARGEPLAQADIAQINAAAFYPVAPRLETASRRIRFEAARPVQGALSLIARDAVQLLGAGFASRIGVCTRPGCGALFVDATRAKNRRWCSDPSCGDRVRVRAYRRRLKTRAAGE